MEILNYIIFFLVFCILLVVTVFLIGHVANGLIFTVWFTSTRRESLPFCGHRQSRNPYRPIGSFGGAVRLLNYIVVGLKIVATDRTLKQEGRCGVLPPSVFQRGLLLHLSRPMSLTSSVHANHLVPVSCLCQARACCCPLLLTSLVGWHHHSPPLPSVPRPLTCPTIGCLQQQEDVLSPPCMTHPR